MIQNHAKVKFFLFLVILAFHLSSSGQNKQYFQQQVDYNINVSLDDTKHELKGVISMVYVNNSPDTLPMLYMHLWPNAYKNTGTAFAKQQLENGETAFWFAKSEERGYIDGLDFKVNNLPVAWHLDSTHIDIAIIELNSPLRPGDEIVILTPFHVKLPESFSRLGHKDQSYQITQWYPKPAVYDKEGWHPMPYLDQGEFYSEFGNFDVTINVPANYVVGASGELQTQSELVWLREKVAYTKTLTKPDTTHKYFPPSDTARKTLKYKLENAHDFAWFADKRFYVLEGLVAVPGTNDTVTTWSMFTPYDFKHWRKSIPYINNAVEHYSKNLGPYPYKTATAVEGALSAGGGMEYPTITIIGNVQNDRQLETVIVHEVGHFWLYGILGTNERIDPWMDEGINSFYENKYFDDYYPGHKMLEGAPRLTNFFGVGHYNRNYFSQLAYWFQATTNRDQAVDLPSEEYTATNYGAIVYAKSALAFQHLRGYLGDSTFDAAMTRYYDQWKFKHPGPDDLRKAFEQVTDKDLSWFFDDLLKTTMPVDYKITKVKKDKDYTQFVYVTVTNTTGLATPFSISGVTGGEIDTTVWYEPVVEDTTVRFPARDYDYYRIDAEEEMVEYSRSNNTYRKRGLFHKSESLSFQFLGSLDDPYKNQLFVSPFFAFNNYDKTMIGLALFNHTFPFKNFEFDLIPMYAIGTKSFTGVGRFTYNQQPRTGKLQLIQYRLAARRFSYLLIPTVAQWSKIEPSVKFQFKPRTPRNPDRFSITFRSVNIFQDYLSGVKKLNQHYYVNEAGFQYRREQTLHPFGAEAYIRQGETFMNAFAIANFQIDYLKAKDQLNIRLFIGGFLYNNKGSSDIRPPHPVFQLSGSTGSPNEKLIMFQDDYMFDHLYLDRNGFDPVLSHQVVTKDGGFRSITIIGDSKRFLTTATADATAPGPIPVKLFAGVGGFQDDLKKFHLVAELGLAVYIIPDVLEINVPFITTDNIKLNQESGLGLDKFYEKITFTFNLSRIDPFMQLRNRAL